ncbi:MAG: hypothetical protein ACWA5A_03265 [Marinibacterium sp.]
MQPHPDFADSTLPRTAALGEGFHLSPLSPSEVDEDLAAVTGSERVLTGVFGGTWPQGLTRADNLIDLAWHDREFTARRSFAWIVRDDAGTYLGCAYLYPALGRRGSGQAVTWMCDTPERLNLLARFNRRFLDWLAPFLPSGYDLAHRCNAQPD